MAIKILTNDGATVILTFDYYYKKDFYSLKQVTRTSRKSGKIKRFHMNFIYLIAAILKKKKKYVNYSFLKILNNLFLITL